MTLALYRAYRPGTLAAVVGQDHVTGPLRRALASGRIHHAYLFSGPRGCGKTSTARILARSLNCEQGPTPDPCGVCDSCVSLAPNGPGSQDVIELDAASHGGVDDTRDLRDRVIYSPALSRYRIYIIDEAHMVSTQGFNALLKVIEEPPEHVRFIFATTEPEKVLGTIRSRTFHYAFRLVGQSVLSDHLAALCQAEGVSVDRATLPLVAGASGGSVRDALSILGQLIAGSDDAGLTVEYVAAGLGVTDSGLLQGVLAALADRDGAAAFGAIQAVVESGHDPRRFLSDLLARLRDLLVLQHVPSEEQSALLHLPTDQIEALRAEAARFGPHELSRAADLVSAGLSELKGATAPQLQLELLVARLLLPAADDSASGFAARLDRLERTVATGVIHAPLAAGPSAPSAAPAASGSAGAPADTQTRRPERPTRRAMPPPRLSDVAPASAPGAAGRFVADSGTADDRAPAIAAETAAPSGGAEIDVVRDGWPAVLAELGKRSRVAWALWEGSQPVAVRDRCLAVAVADQGRLASIRASRREELLRQVIIDVLRLDLKVSPEPAHPPTGGNPVLSVASPDDPDLPGGDASGVDLVMRELGAVPIGEVADS